MHGENISYAYGFWFLVLVNVALFGFFILSFLTPFKKREWRAMGVTLGFFVALFTEMYGIPLTIYILTAILGRRYPALNPFSHASGHLWLTFLGGGAVCLCKTPSVFRTLRCHDRDAYPVAYYHNGRDVSCARLYLLPLSEKGRGGDDQDLRG